MKLYHSLYIVIIISNVLFAQSASLAHVSTISDTYIAVPMTVLNFPNIEAINFKISFDSDVLDSISVTKNNSEICNSCYNLNYSVIVDTLAVVLYNIESSDIFSGDGHIIDLNFKLVGSGTATN